MWEGIILWELSKEDHRGEYDGADEDEQHEEKDLAERGTDS